VNKELQFTEYINSHKNLIFKVASVYCYNTEERKDLVQEIVLQLWKSFPRYDSSFKFSTWAYRIALNVCISYVRKTIVRNKTIKEYKEFIEVDIVESCQECENLNRLYKVFEILKPIERAIITLNLEGCSNKEIAEIIGITPTNVSTRILRIKNKLKNHLIT
jgi:RNA polymerase sigma-70 factor, ECF subfamily